MPAHFSTRATATAARALALALSALLPALATAAVGAGGDTISKASLNVNDLRFRLIDLALDDGIAPSVSFSGFLTGEGSTLSPVTEIGVDSLYISTETLPKSVTDLSRPDANAFLGLAPGVTQAAIDGSTVLTLNRGLQLETSLTTGMVSNLASPKTVIFQSSNQYEDAGWLYETSSTQSRQNFALIGYSTSRISTQTAPPANPEDPVDYDLESLRITLSPNTLLLVEGTAQATVQADRTLLSSFIQNAKGSVSDGGSAYAYQLETDVNTNLDMRVYTYTYKYGEPGDPLDYGNYSEAGQISGFTWAKGVNYTEDFFNLGYDAITGEPVTSTDTALTRTFSKAISLPMFNATNQPLVGELRVIASANAGQMVTVTADDYVTVTTQLGVVPEPATYALMGLGLLGIAALRQRAVAA